MSFKHDEDSCSHHFCKKMFNSKDKHLKTQHGNENKLGDVCKDCDNLYQSQVSKGSVQVLYKQVFPNSGPLTPP